MTTTGLILRLSGLLQSWGERGVFHHRDTAPFPTRSALIGMFAAAQGRTREEALAPYPKFPDTPDHRDLTFTLRIDRPGTLYRDYHTVGGGRPPEESLHTAKGGHRPPAGSTLISHRDYLAGAVFTAAVQGPDALITHIADTLNQPRYAPSSAAAPAFPTSRSSSPAPTTRSPNSASAFPSASAHHPAPALTASPSPSSSNTRLPATAPPTPTGNRPANRSTSPPQADATYLAPCGSPPKNFPPASTPGRAPSTPWPPTCTEHTCDHTDAYRPQPPPPRGPQRPRGLPPAAQNAHAPGPRQPRAVPRAAAGLLYRLEPAAEPVVFVQTAHQPDLTSLPRHYASAQSRDLTAMFTGLQPGLPVHYRINAAPLASRSATAVRDPVTGGRRGKRTPWPATTHWPGGTAVPPRQDSRSSPATAPHGPSPAAIAAQDRTTG